MSDPVILVCMRADDERLFKFTDDVRGTCDDCGVAIVWRPHAPDPAIRICLSCTSKRLRAENGEVEIGITAETAREVKLAIAKTDGVQ